MTLHISHRELNGVTVIDAAGRITIGQNANALGDYFRSLVADGKKDLVLNLGAVTFVDSMGVGSIVAGYTSVNGHGGALKLVKPNNVVKLLLEVSGLHKLFEVYEDEGAALGSFRG
jgi:anti-sigma B factor antagonist